MDRSAEDMKSMGFFGIFKQSFKTIFSCKKLFTQITLTLILPLTLIFFADSEISNHLFFKIESTLFIDFNTYRRDISVTDWLYYGLFRIIYFTLITVFSLLSTAAVVFTIACIYTNRNVVFMQVIKNVSKIWKKVFVTFVLIYLALFVYIGILNLTLIISKSLLGYSISGSAFIISFLILYILGFLYLTVVLQLTSVVSVLENTCGFKATKKGVYLFNGKKKVGMSIAFVLYLFLIVLGIVYGLFVEKGKEFFELAMIWRVMIGILIGTFLVILFLLFIVIQTVLYLVCKSYHQEAVDKVSLSTFLGEYMEEIDTLGRAQTQDV